MGRTTPEAPMTVQEALDTLKSLGDEGVHVAVRADLDQ